MITVTNTLSGRKEEFQPISDVVRMYVCGLTPKNDPHLGHARLFIANDIIRRYLEYRGYPVKYVQNFTDIDDKIILAGQRENIPPAEAARRYMTGYFQVMDALGVRRADEFTYVTEYIPQIIAFIQGLIDKGHAYALEAAADNDVYFATDTFPGYGKLSKRNEDATMAGARIAADERKRDLRDFALWKAAKPGEPWWESPWGHGRPGWHIECSTMSMAVLGEQIDIHGGGSDLIFPHHENEIAQSEALSGKDPFAKYWLHTGLLQLGADKMAHSGDFITIRSVLATTPAPALRMYLLAQSYRTQFTYFPAQLALFTARWRRWCDAVQAAKVLGTVGTAPPQQYQTATLEQIRNEFIAAMDDDFNTSGAVATIDAAIKRLNETVAKTKGAPTDQQKIILQEGITLIEELTTTLGITLDLSLDIQRAIDDEARNAIEKLLQQRAELRAAKQWQESDRLRDEIEGTYGVNIQDTPNGAVWQIRQK